MIREFLDDIRTSLIIKLMTKGEKEMMGMFFAQRVILGKTSFDAVPNSLKAQVAEVLIDSGLMDLVPDEYKKDI